MAEYLVVIPKYDNDVVTELVKLGVGTIEECITASQQVVDYHDINVVADKVNEIKNRLPVDVCVSCIYYYIHDSIACVFDTRYTER